MDRKGQFVTSEESERRKPGRPRRYGQGRINATVRFTPERYADLKAAAEEQRRSISEEVEARVERSFTEAAFEKIARDLKANSSEMVEIAAKLLDKAMARIDELEKAQTLNEEAIERAVTRALAKARLTIGDGK
jgi:hypothetical protein